MKRYEYIFWLLAGISLFAFSNGNYAIPVAAWVAPIALLRFLDGQGIPGKLVVLFVAMAAAAFFMLWDIVPSTIGPLTYILIVYYAFMWFMPYLVHSLVAESYKSYISSLVFPAAGVSAEYLNTVFFGSWGSMAYAQTADLPLVQIVSVFGIWGLTFLTLWFGSSFHWFWRQEKTWQAFSQKGWIYLTVLPLVLAYGGLRLHFYNPGSNTVKVMGMTPENALQQIMEKIRENGFESSGNIVAKDREVARTIFNKAVTRVFTELQSSFVNGTDIVVLPETALPILAEDEETFIGFSRAFAKTNATWFVAGYFLRPALNSNELPENKAIMINDQGDIVLEYLKAYPVPGAGHRAGEKIIPVVNTDFGDIAIAICYDMDFPDLIRQAARKKTDIMIVPAWDWEAINPLHAEMAIFRAIENGFSLVRQTGDGLSVMADPVGKVYTRMNAETTPDNIMIGEIPVRRYPTIYSVIGDVFAWASLFFVGYTILRRFLWLRY